MNLPKFFKIYPQKRDLIILLKTILIIYIIILLFLFAFQRKAMYFPNKDISISSHWQPLKNNNNKIIALKKINNSMAYNVLVFHGNAGNANIKNYYHIIFPYANIIVAEYPGYGFRANEKINKKNIIEASEEIMEEVLKDGKPIILFGESLGSAVASEMAIKYHIKNLVLATPYDDISSLAQSKFPILPIYPLILDRYNNKNTLKKFKGNLIILIAEHDSVIPVRFAYNLSKSIRRDINKLEVLIKKSNHNNYVSHLSEDNKKEIHKFLQFIR